MKYYVLDRDGVDSADVNFHKHFPNGEGEYELSDEQVVAAIKDLGRVIIHEHIDITYTSEKYEHIEPAYTETYWDGRKRSFPAKTYLRTRRVRHETPTGKWVIEFQNGYD